MSTSQAMLDADGGRVQPGGRLSDRLAACTRHRRRTEPDGGIAAHRARRSRSTRPTAPTPVERRRRQPRRNGKPQATAAATAAPTAAATAAATAATRRPAREPASGQAQPSWRRTSAATTPPSARPLTWGLTTPITLPIARMPSSCTPRSAIVVVTRSAISSARELLGQVVGDHGGLGALLGGHLGAAGVVERLGRLAALLGLAGEHPEHVVVGELARLLAGDLGVGDRGQHHPQGGGPHLVTGLDRGGEVGAQTVLELAHGGQCGSLAAWQTRGFARS